MASLVCDRTPCDYMQAAIDALVTDSYRGDKFSIRVAAHVDPRISFLVPLKYCPFCGTRIDPQWVKNFYRPAEMTAGTEAEEEGAESRPSVVSSARGQRR